MSRLDRLGGRVVKQDDGGALNVQDLDTKQLLQAILLQLELMTAILTEMTDTDLEPRDINIRDMEE